MSAVYVLFVCKRYTEYRDVDSLTGYESTPEPEIFGVYSSKKRAKKNIDKALSNRLYKEECVLRDLGYNVVSYKIEEKPQESKYKGFEIEVIGLGWDEHTGEPKKYKYEISYHCYIRRYVVD